MSEYRRTRRPRKRPGSGQGYQPPKKSFGNRIKFPYRLFPVAEEVRFIPGFYGFCGECYMHVDAGPDRSYTCTNVVYDGPKDLDPSGKCGHVGVLEPDEVSPDAINWAAFHPTWGKRGWTVQSNNRGGELAESRPCLLHDAHLADPENVYPGEKHAITMIRLGAFHLAEKRDGDKTWKQKDRCEGRGCQMCRDKIEKIWGKLEYVNLGKKFYGQLTGFERRIRAKHDDCLNCNEGHVRTMGWECVECSAKMLDMYEDACSERQLIEFGATPLECSNCGHWGLPGEVMECYLEENDQGVVAGCEEPRGYDIFDADLSIGRADGSLFLDDVVRLGPLEDKYEKLATPMEFAFLASCPPRKQAEYMHINLNEPASRPYGKGEGDDTDDYAD